MSDRAGQCGQRRPPFPGHYPFALAALLLLTSFSDGLAQGWKTDILRDTFGYGEGTPADVDWSEVQQGCGARDCIP